jgi:hypothetical protein
VGGPSTLEYKIKSLNIRKSHFTFGGSPRENREFRNIRKIRQPAIAVPPVSPSVSIGYDWRSVCRYKEPSGVKPLWPAESTEV